MSAARMIKYNGKVIKLRSLATLKGCAIKTITRILEELGLTGEISGNVLDNALKLRCRKRITIDGVVLTHLEVRKKFHVGDRKIAKILKTYGRALTSSMFEKGIKNKNSIAAPKKDYNPDKRERELLAKIKGPSEWELANLNPRYIGSKARETRYGVASGILPSASMID